MIPFARIAIVSSLALMAAGCDDAKGKSESIGIIGGEDGPTAVWLTTRFPLWLETGPLEPEFLDCTIPVFATEPGTSIECVLASLEETLNLSLGKGIDWNGFAGDGIELAFNERPRQTLFYD